MMMKKRRRMPSSNRRRVLQYRSAQEAILECVREWNAVVTIQRAARRSHVLTAGFVVL